MLKGDKQYTNILTIDYITDVYSSHSFQYIKKCCRTRFAHSSFVNGSTIKSGIHEVYKLSR